MQTHTHTYAKLWKCRYENMNNDELVANFGIKVKQFTKCGYGIIFSYVFSCICASFIDKFVKNLCQFSI